MNSANLMNETELQKVDKLKEFIVKELQEIDPAEFEDEDAGGQERADGLAGQLAKRLVSLGLSIA